MKPVSPAQDDLPFMSIASHERFPGRAVLTCHEVAAVFRMSVCHVRDLIDEGRLGAINISGQPVKPGKHSAAERNYYRVPVSAYDQFIAINKTL